MKQFNDTYKTDTITDNLCSEWEFGEFEQHILQNRRNEFGLSQQQVADAAQIQIQQYQKFESGTKLLSNASMKTGLAICNVLKLDPYRFA